MKEIKKDIEDMTYDEASLHLKEVVENLESNESSLEDLLKMHSIGQNLLKRCQTLLNKAEMQINEFHQETKKESQ